MSAIPRSRVLSETVSAPLRKVAGRRWQLAAGTGVLQMLIVCLTVWLAAALVSGSFDLPVAVRFTVSAVAWCTLVASLAIFLRPAFSRWTLSGVARQLESDLND